MENDRELLELAAKAAGLNGVWTDLARPRSLFLVDGDDSYCWDPLFDDGDALRLAVKLSISVFPPVLDQGDFAVASIEEGVIGEDGSTWIQEPIKDDGAVASVRRAIVRAAAEIGRAMG